MENYPKFSEILIHWFWQIRTTVPGSGCTFSDSYCYKIFADVFYGTYLCTFLYFLHFLYYKKYKKYIGTIKNICEYVIKIRARKNAAWPRNSGSNLLEPVYLLKFPKILDRFPAIHFHSNGRALENFQNYFKHSDFKNCHNILDHNSKKYCSCTPEKFIYWCGLYSRENCIQGIFWSAAGSIRDHECTQIENVCRMMVRVRTITY